MQLFAAHEATFGATMMTNAETLVFVCDVPVEYIHCVSKTIDTDVAHYNFNTHQPILVIFGRDVAERVCYQKVICYPTSPN